MIIDFSKIQGTLKNVQKPDPVIIYPGLQLIVRIEDQGAYGYVTVTMQFVNDSTKNYSIKIDFAKMESAVRFAELVDGALQYKPHEMKKYFPEYYL